MAITIQDKEYLQWVKDLGRRYRRSQIKAAVRVNEEMLRFYWELGRGIVEKQNKKPRYLETAKRYALCPSMDYRLICQ